MKKCTHDRYRAKEYMMIGNALKAMGRGQVVWIGIRIKKCEDCGVDISHAERVPVKTADEYLGGL